MLKKAGIVVATAAAGLLAVSPLAFAGSKHDHHGSEQTGSGDDQVNSVTEDRERSSSGLVNVDALNGDNEVNVPIQVCNNNVPVNVLGVQVTDIVADVTAALGVLGAAETDEEGATGDTCVQANESGTDIEQDNER